jgi:5-hydroxyisourate hydrolase
MRKMSDNEGKITVHVLDTVRGRGAAGVGLILANIAGETRKILARSQTNDDGRTDVPLLAGAAMHAGIYEVVFDVGVWAGAASDFYDLIPVRFRINDPGGHYHVPLLLSGYGYTTYRGT